ncbi:hypothetical protein E3N88_27452 [Mikania micrantha]|uniref:Aminotransferase-like plant mobile domain-containing protein n=1 Tax=Mikania micrantha TaxID=192012 RepID=A0A5N6MXC2_9ASTR|nr:hypothetical protein E3N88_27452 [Mikania micrantha]
MSYDLHPGPIVDDVLFLKDSHRARDIFNNKETKNLVFRRADQKFFSLFNNNPITENVKRYVNIAGFGGLLDCGYRNLDHGLLEALIERWRPETHTFHLPIGEATVTLKDVNVLWGLPIEGGVVSNLCKATSSNANNIGGPMYILQLWAWCRITTIAPRILHPFDNTRPYGAMWREKLTYKDVISHSLRACRSQLHCLQEGEFKWRPYEKVISFLPEICTSGIRSWQSECYVIYWDVVEFYTPQMVMRQFGMVQHIPSPFPLSINDHMKLHTLTRSGKPERNWMNTHLEYVTVWNQRWQNVIQGVLCATPTVEPNYMQWFWSRTILYITNPKSQEVMQPVFQDHGSRSQFLVPQNVRVWNTSSVYAGSCKTRVQQSTWALRVCWGEQPMRQSEWQKAARSLAISVKNMLHIMLEKHSKELRKKKYLN